MVEEIIGLSMFGSLCDFFQRLFWSKSSREGKEAEESGKKGRRESKEGKQEGWMEGGGGDIKGGGDQEFVS